MNYFIIWLIICYFICQVQADINSTSGAVSYLSRFGYMDSQSEIASRSGNFNLEKFLLKFQEFFKLQKTGKLDKNTLKIMNAPRCGNPDLFPDEDSSEKRRYRRKRYALQGSTWNKNHLTWTVSKFSKRPNLKNKSKQIIRTLDRAFSFWASQSGLSFSYTPNKGADIDIRFERLDHRDGSPFDGENNTLAHAFFPKWGGDVHFDDDEDWTMDDYNENGVHLLSVAVHEIGHSLGLSHSNVENSVMYPTYDGLRTWLSKDDIQGIQKLYGPPSSSNKPPVTVSRKEENDDNLCENFDIDSGLCYKPHYCIAFKGNYVHKFKTDGALAGGNYPKKINEIFLTMSGPIDAAFKEDNKMFLIKKDMVYEFEKFFTRPIRIFNFRKLIPGWKWNEAKRIDAIYKKRRTGNIYIFSGNYYWRFHRDKGLSSNYPKPISSFDNLPGDLDAVLDWDDNESLFFKGNDYWVYNEALNKMKTIEPSNVQDDFLKCKKY